jgi:hypothetical protein
MFQTELFIFYFKFLQIEGCTCSKTRIIFARFLSRWVLAALLSAVPDLACVQNVYIDREKAGCVFPAYV